MCNRIGDEVVFSVGDKVINRSKYDLNNTGIIGKRMQGKNFFGYIKYNYVVRWCDGNETQERPYDLVLYSEDLPIPKYNIGQKVEVNRQLPNIGIISQVVLFFKEISYHINLDCNKSYSWDCRHGDGHYSENNVKEYIEQNIDLKSPKYAVGMTFTYEKHTVKISDIGHNTQGEVYYNVFWLDMLGSFPQSFEFPFRAWLPESCIDESTEKTHEVVLYPYIHCPTCKGTGETILSYTKNNKNEIIFKYGPCPTCKGAKKIRSDLDKIVGTTKENGEKVTVTWEAPAIVNDVMIQEGKYVINNE
jgi:hypothetical protein